MSTLKFVENHVEVLARIENIVVQFHEQGHVSHDYDAIRVFEALMSYYRAITTNFSLPIPKLSSQGEQALYEVIKVLIHGEDAKKAFDCLKRLKKSALFWNKKNGSQGDLSYISRFLGTGLRKSEFQD